MALPESAGHISYRYITATELKPRIYEITTGMAVDKSLWDVMPLREPWSPASLKILTLSDEASMRLVKQAETDPDAFDPVSYVLVLILGCTVTQHTGLNEALGLFAARVISGKLVRPTGPGRTKGSGRYDRYILIAQYIICKLVVQTTTLHVGRNRVPSGPANLSACEAVAEAFHQVETKCTGNRIHTTWRVVSRKWWKLFHGVSERVDVWPRYATGSRFSVTSG